MRTHATQDMVTALCAPTRLVLVEGHITPDASKVYSVYMFVADLSAVLAHAVAPCS